MKFEKFSEFWEQGVRSWFATETLSDEQEQIFAREICKIKTNSASIVYHNYEAIKKIVKDNYFMDDTHNNISRYKRAAVIIYAILKSDPLVRIDNGVKRHTYFLKQRFAIYMAFSSILVDYDKEKVMAKLAIERKTNPLATVFRANCLGKEDDKQDNFLTSFYKDLEFAEIYKNYDVLAIANILGLIVETSSILTPDMLVSDEVAAQITSTKL